MKDYGITNTHQAAQCKAEGGMFYIREDNPIPHIELKKDYNIMEQRNAARMTAQQLILNGLNFLVFVDCLTKQDRKEIRDQLTNIISEI